ncbi:MAG TPA: hypothetical protein HA362_04820 [Nanoarchaeota archaeon]|nr:hypothetical protein [Nanoarchaeota archaeon]
MKKRLIAIVLVMGLVLVSIASAGIFDRFKSKAIVAPEMDLPAVEEAIGERFDIPAPPRIPTKADAGYYAESSRGAGVWGHNPTTYQGVYGSSKEGTGVAAVTEKGLWGVWAYNQKAETTGWLGAYRTGVLGLVKDAKLFAGEFIGGSGVYSEKGYATRNDMGQVVQMLPGTYTFETVDGKLVTVTNGIVTAIKSKVR